MKRTGYNAEGEDPWDDFDRWDAEQARLEREEEEEASGKWYDGPEYVPECER